MTTTGDSYELLPVPTRDRLGEGPWWCTRSERLIWVDILARTVHRASLDGDDVRAWHTPSEVGFALGRTLSELLVGLRDGLHRLDTGTGTTTPEVALDSDHLTHRVNDGKTDRAGRVWFGTMHEEETDATASFYRYDDAGLSTQLTGITTSNGLGWSPDNTVMYHTDSMTRRIIAYRFDADDGSLRDRRVFAQDPSAYVPDGLTVDVDGCVWAAKWGGGKVVRYRPDGVIDLQWRLPVARPTSCMFVGTDLRTLAVTSAGAGPDCTPLGDLDGAVFLIPTTTQGMPEEPVAVTRPEPGDRARRQRQTRTKNPITDRNKEF